MHLRNGSRHDGIASRFTRDDERLQDRYTAGDQRSQRPRKPGDRRFPCQVAEKRGAQLGPIDEVAPQPGAASYLADDNKDENYTEQRNPMGLHELANANDEESDGRQRFVAQHVMKDDFELRHNNDQEEGHDP